MTFTLVDVVAICSGILTIAGVISIGVKIYNAGKAPIEELKKEVEELKRKSEEHDNYFKCDKVRFDDIEEGNRIMQKCMLALLKHTKDDQDLEGINKAEKDLEEYLIDKK